MPVLGDFERCVSSAIGARAIEALEPKLLGTSCARRSGVPFPVLHGREVTLTRALPRRLATSLSAAFFAFTAAAYGAPPTEGTDADDDAFAQVAEFDESRCGKRSSTVIHVRGRRVRFEVLLGGAELYPVDEARVLILSGLSCAQPIATLVDARREQPRVRQWRLAVKWPGALSVKTANNDVVLVGGSSGSALGTVCFLRPHHKAWCREGSSFFVLRGGLVALLSEADSNEVRADVVSSTCPERIVVSFRLPHCASIAKTERPNRIVFTGCETSLERALPTPKDSR